MKSAAAQHLAKVAEAVVRNEKTFGDASKVEVYAFTRKSSERDLNSIKQLNFRRAGLNSDDIGAKEMQTLSAEQLAEHLLNANSQPDDQNAFDKAKSELEAAINLVKSDPQLQIYGTNHSDEDGSWQVLDIIDTSNQEILLIKIGYNGT